MPFAWIYQGICTLRRTFLLRYKQRQFLVPVIVVGNITVGGVGKTPLVIAIATALSQKGLKVGIVSRGYGAQLRVFPHLVRVDSPAALVGDEPLLIAERTACPVVIDPDRVAAIDYLLQQHPCDVVLSDDGLQHYAMGRAIEIVVVDGLRGFGNGFCLPAGPLREAVSRIRHSDLVVMNSQGQTLKIDTGKIKQFSMQLVPSGLINLVDGKSYPPQSLGASVAAVAGIGNPQRFFLTLAQMGLSVSEYAFPDHYRFTAKDFDFSEKVVVMTEKDAVKCRKFAQKNWFYLTVEAQLTDDFWHALYSHPQLQRLLLL